MRALRESSGEQGYPDAGEDDLPVAKRAGAEDRQMFVDGEVGTCQPPWRCFARCADFRTSSSPMRLK